MPEVRSLAGAATAGAFSPAMWRPTDIEIPRLCGVCDIKVGARTCGIGSAGGLRGRVTSVLRQMGPAARPPALRGCRRTGTLGYFRLDAVVAKLESEEAFR
jgi:hypothetical protein